MPCPEVEFRTVDAKGQPSHDYLVDGVWVPSVSYILKTNGFCDYAGVRKDVMENARQFGTAVDLACQLLDEDDLDPEYNDPKVMPRLEGWSKFCREWEFKPLIVAKPMSHAMNGMIYGMTPDRYGTCKLGNVVIDIKNTAEIMPSHQIQLAGYIQPFKTEGNGVNRFVVQLVDGGYKLHEFKDRQDERIFGAALACTYWKLAKGIK